MNETGTTMYGALPPVSGLNRVPGFDPEKFIRKAVSDNREVFYLDLKYKKLWFRLAYPKGRIKKTALKITEQIAIIEARIYLDKDDAEPVSSFIAQRNANDRPGSLYIESAQYAAENQALIDAGFGLQFCDVSQGADAELFDAGIPAGTADSGIAASAQAEPVPASDETNAPEAQTVLAAPTESRPAQQVTAEQQNEAIPVPQAESAPETAAAEPPAEEQTETIPVAASERQTADIPAAETGAAAERSPAQAVLEVIAGGQQPDTASQPQPEPEYTPDMPVDAILALMTPEGAAAVVVDTGVCSGWTLADVAEKRPASLKWYLNGYTGNNNILRAGATLLLGRGMEKLAG